MVFKTLMLGKHSLAECGLRKDLAEAATVWMEDHALTNIANAAGALTGILGRG